MAITKDKVVFSRNMAAYLLLKGCDLKGMKPDLKNRESGAKVFLFKWDDKLDKCIAEYPDCRSKMFEAISK